MRFVLAAALAACFTQGPDFRTEREAWVMGTRLRIEIHAGDAARGPEVAERVLRKAEGLERMLSTWDSTSAMARVNGAPPGFAVAVPSSLTLLLAEAREWSVRTGGAFEPTLGALVDVWDLRGSGRSPSAEELTAALAASGSGVFEIRDSGGTVVRRQAEGWLDTGAFGKGAALREVAHLLRVHRIERALVDLGGQLWVTADPSRPWPVAVADPRDRGRPAVPLALSDVSVATSGASERWVEVNGRRYGHILDPRTGFPVPDWGSVTVVSPDPLEADILSTALYVMGPREGLAWVKKELPHLAVLFLESSRRSPEGLRATWTSSMERWLAQGSSTEQYLQSPNTTSTRFPIS